MLSEQIRAIGELAHVIVQAALRAAAAAADGDDEPQALADIDLAAAAADALSSNETQFLPCPHETEAVQSATRLAERMLATLAEADAARVAAETSDEWPAGHWMDDTGPGTVPRWRRSRFNPGRIWGTGTAICVPGEDRDVVRVRGVQFENGAAYVGLMANANRSGNRPECYFGAAAAREVANALLEWAHAVDTSVKPKTQRRRWRRIDAKGDAAREGQYVRTVAA